METKLHHSSLQDEQEQLYQLFTSLNIEQNSEYGHQIERWMSDYESINKQLEIEGDSIRLEQEQEALAVNLRALWIAYAHSFSDVLFKSPPLKEPKWLPSNISIDYSYERNLQPQHLEKKAKSYRTSHIDWKSDHVILSSGMACISTLFQSLFAMFKPTKARPVEISVWGDYFETRVLMDLYTRESTNIKRLKHTEGFTDVIQETDIFFIEPTRYNWELDLFPFDAFIESLYGTDERIKFLVVDTTLSGESLPIQKWLEKLKQVPNVIFIQLHSCLKLDQQGLELSNGGLLSIYTLEKNESTMPTAEQFCNHIRKIRTILGTSLSFEELALLDAPFFFDRKVMKDYSDIVFLHNAQLAKSVHSRGIFQKVAHPVLENTLNQAAPFVVFHLREGELSNYSFLLGVVNEEAEKHNVTFDLGSSFGFRSHRFEVILPNMQEKKGLFKVAMGYRNGPSKHFVIGLFKKLCDYHTFEELRKEYSHVKPVHLENVNEY